MFKYFDGADEFVIEPLIKRVCDPQHTSFVTKTPDRHGIGTARPVAVG